MAIYTVVPTVDRTAFNVAIQGSDGIRQTILGFENPTIITFQKLGIDLRRPQQDMLLEAIRDFVAKHEADRAFR